MIAWKQHDVKLSGVSRAPTGNRPRIVPIPRERNGHYTISANKMETNAFKTLLHHWPDDNWTHCFHECGWRDSNPRFRHGEAAILTRLIHIRILESWFHMRALAWNAIHDYVGQTGFEPAHSLLFRSHNPARQTKFASAHMDEHEHSMITMRSYHLRIKETGTSGLPYFHVMRYVQCIHDGIRMIPANF